MKITFILPKVSYDGVSKVGLTQANLLRDEYDVDVIYLINERRKIEDLTKNLSLYSPIPSIFSRILYPISNLFLNTKTDFIIAHNIPSSIIASKIKEKRNIKYLTYIHDPQYKKIPGSFFGFRINQIKKSLKNSKVILTNSNRTSSKLKSEYIVDSTTLYPGCFPIKYKYLNKEREDFLLFVHFIAPLPSFYFLAKFLKDNPKIKLVIIGGRRPLWNIVFKYYKEKFRNRVKFIFEAKEKILKKYYIKAKAVVVPESENFGLTPLEAAACGCPSIVVKDSGVVEIFKVGKEIITFEENNIKDFENCVKLLEDSKLSKKIGINAWKKAKKYSWNFHIKELKRKIVE